MAKVTKKRTAFGTSMGVSSIIAILVILVLVVFSALAIATSKADLRLSQKTAESILAYYDADAAAEDRLAEISASISVSGSWQTDLSEDDYSVSSVADGTLVAFTVPVDETSNLDVEVIVSGNGDLTRKLWRVVPAKEWISDDSLNLYVP